MTLFRFFRDLLKSVVLVLCFVALIALALGGYFTQFWFPTTIVIFFGLACVFQLAGRERTRRQHIASLRHEFAPDTTMDRPPHIPDHLG